MNWLKNKAINKAYIAELLYGANTSTSRSKLMQKVTGRKNFTDEETKRLEQIKTQLLKELAS